MKKKLYLTRRIRRNGQSPNKPKIVQNNPITSIPSNPHSGDAPSHIPGGVWRSVASARPLSDLERRALALWAPPEVIDQWPGKAKAIRHAVGMELGCTELIEKEEPQQQRCPDHMIMNGTAA